MVAQEVSDVAPIAATAAVHSSIVRVRYMSLGVRVRVMNHLAGIFGIGTGSLRRPIAATSVSSGTVP